jgi:peroxiredoxin
MSTHLTTQELDAARTKYRGEIIPADALSVMDAETDGAEHLPVPGTFLVDGKGVIRLAHIDVDNTRRLDPDDVITTLRNLRPGQN